MLIDSSYIKRVSEGKRVLDIGCGENKFMGSTGIDFSDVEGVGISHNLENFPYPIEDNSFDVVLLRNVIEHINGIVGLMEEIHRVSINGADVLISTPHFSSLYSYQDPTHVRHLAYDSMDYFTDKTKHANFYSKKIFKMESKMIDFGKSVPFSYIAKGIFKLSKHKYEKHFSFIFPANQLHYHLNVVK
jgi:ubiquinone/menaquinone biosynthesis C-methylase UbiE